MLQSIKLNNFQLFKFTEVTLNKINVISGVNLDDTQSSSNGSGKTTLAKNAIIFLLYNDVSGINLKDLIHIGSKETEVEGIIKKGNDTYRIIRTIPAGLTIYKNQVEIEGNTATIKQKYINDVFGDYEFFKKFRMIDTKGINLLDLGITSLRKELMNFVDDLFTGIRKNLLLEKLNRETFNINKRLYKFNLSERRLSILDTGVKDLKAKVDFNKNELGILQSEYNKVNGEYIGNKKNIGLLNENLATNSANINLNGKHVAGYMSKLTFDVNTTEIESEQSTGESVCQSLNEERELLMKEIGKINMRIYSINEKINQNSQDSIKVHNEITCLDDVAIGSKCDKCGAIIDSKHKDIYKEEKYQILADLDFAQSESQEELETETIVLKDKESSLTELEKTIVGLKKNLDDNNKLLKTLIAETAENSKLTALIDSLTAQNKSLDSENLVTHNAIKNITSSFSLQEGLLQSLTHEISVANDKIEYFERKLQKTQECLLKLKEAFKFIEYKYTGKDVLLYDESIKTLDAFAGYYINEWLKQLAVIINNLLKNVNMQVEFNAERDFIKIKNGENELKYEQLSAGQKCFLSSVFKLAILLHKGENEGIIIADEGLGNMDAVNFLKFVEICKTLPFQVFVIYQNLPEIDDVNKINIVRQNGESKIQ